MTSGITSNLFGARFAGLRGGSPIGTLAGQIAKGIVASYARALGAGPFAQAMLPTVMQFQGVRLPQGGAQTGRREPVEQASWTATLSGGGKGAIDLGDGYTLGLDENNSEVTIHNAATGETTRIWGDPHVDVDGQHTFDFWGTTTFQLENGTKITIDTEQFAGNPDMYTASGLTITKGDRAIEVKGIGQNELGDLSITQASNGRAVDARTRDGFVLRENASGSGWRSQWTGQVATQTDLDATKPGGAYAPGSEMPSLGEIKDVLSSFLMLGVVGAMINGGERIGRR